MGQDPPVLRLALAPAQRRAAIAALQRAPCRTHAIGDAPPALLVGRCLSRSQRTRAGRVDLCLVDGRLQAGGRTLPWLRLELRARSGSPAAVTLLATRWVQQFGAVLDPFAPEVQAGLLAAGPAPWPARQAQRPGCAAGAPVPAAFAAVVGECLAQVIDNASALALSPPGAEAAQVHQLRVGLRRLRSAWRLFRGWVEPPPEALVAGLQALFQALGTTRDADVFAAGIGAELAAAGAPPLATALGSPAIDATALARAAPTQRLLLQAWSWHAALAAPPVDAADATPLSLLAARRLGRWHEHLQAAALRFDTLDDDALHALRKAVKRQRYAVEFIAPELRRRRCERYLQRLAAVQDRLGRINDLMVARAAVRSRPANDPGAAFALGWLADRLAEARVDAKPDLLRLVKTPLPWE